MEKIKNFFFNEITIKPKYIIFCKDNEKKYVYQCNPKEQKCKVDDNIIIHDIYIQNTANFNYNIKDYTHAILVTEDDSEYVVNKQFMLDNMFNDIHSSFNRTYKLTCFLDVPVHITSEYDKNGVVNKEAFIDKIKIGILGTACGLFGTAVFCKYYNAE
jgi:hypothetical protein